MSSENNGMTYYKWMHLVKFLGHWDRNGTALLQQSRQPPGAPSQPGICRCDECRADPGFAEVEKKHEEAMKQWKIDCERHKESLKDWEPPETVEYDPRQQPFLALRLEAKVVSEDHRAAVVQLCDSELSYCSDHGVTEETMPEDKPGHISGEDIKALRQIKEVVQNAEIGKEFV